MRPSLILVNGLAEQDISWHFNTCYLSKFFDIHAPNLYQYDSDLLYNLYEKKIPANISWLATRLNEYLVNFGPKPPYYMVGSSLGCQIIMQYAFYDPVNIIKAVFLCPSGLGDDERLFITDNIPRENFYWAVSGVFYNEKKYCTPDIINKIGERLKTKKSKLGALWLTKSIKNSNISHLLPLLKFPMLFLCGKNDKIVNTMNTYKVIYDASNNGSDVYMGIIDKCGHAPQIEKHNIVNNQIKNFLLTDNWRVMCHNRFMLVKSLKKMDIFEPL